MTTLKKKKKARKHLKKKRTRRAYYILMDLFPNGDLNKYLGRKAWDGGKKAESRCIFKQILAGLKEMHAANITHRDLKALNVFVDRSKPRNGCPTVKIGDFGSAARFAPAGEQSPSPASRPCGKACPRHPGWPPTTFYRKQVCWSAPPAQSLLMPASPARKNRCSHISRTVAERNLHAKTAVGCGGTR